MFYSEGKQSTLCVVSKSYHICLYIVLFFILLCYFDRYVISVNQQVEAKPKSYIQNLHSIRKQLIRIEKSAAERYESKTPKRNEWKEIVVSAQSKRYIIEDKISHLLASIINERLNRIGRKNLVLHKINRQRESLASYEGKSIMLNMWATWCVPCIQEFESLKKIYRELRSRNFEILAVSHDESKKQIRTFLKGKGIEFPVYFDPNRHIYRKLVDDTGLPILPFSILIDATGKVFKAYVGEREWDSQESLEEIEIILPQK